MQSGGAAAAQSGYRSDIDGLRAVSVILVVLFHFSAATMPGGFVGVDVFFVISGYLITGLILNGLREGSFSLAEFYARRIRRIAPALFVVIAVTIAAGSIVLMPGDLREAGRSGLYALIGASNFYFLNNTGYFDIASEMLPLLHTWSLGVEEQFYLAWPLLMVWLFKQAKGHCGWIGGAIALVVVASMAANLTVVAQSPKHTFYLPFTRAWELGIGALLVLIPRLGSTAIVRAVAQAMPLAGAAMVIASGCLLHNGLAYPGYHALAPVIGAALVIYHSGHATLVGRVLSLPPLVFIGRISYPLYLWHWPILVLWRHLINGEQPSAGEMVVLGLLSLIVATVSWRYIETPARQGRMPRFRVFAAAGASSAVIGAAALTIVHFDGLPQRISPEARAMSGLDVMWRWPCPQTVELPITDFFLPDRQVQSCALGAGWRQARNKGIVWGDSNAEHFLPMLHAIGLKTGTSFVLVNPCPAIVNERVGRAYPDQPNYSGRCGRHQASVIAMLKSMPEINLVVLSARWSDLAVVLRSEGNASASGAIGLQLLEPAFAELLQQIAGADRRVVIINDIPGIPLADPAACALSRIALPRARICEKDLEVLGYQKLKLIQQPSHVVIRKLGLTFPNTVVLSPEDGMCGDGRCATTVEGEFIYRDGAHFRRNLKPETLNALIAKLGFEEALR